MIIPLLRWKQAELFKPKTSRPRNYSKGYRPISLLFCSGKVAEAVLLLRLQNFVDNEGLYPVYQFGFLRSHSTTQQILRLVENITIALNNKKSTHGSF
jgi:hypothetical protein